MDSNSSSSSSEITTSTWKYDVFVSFRGDDTRNNFISHLFAALKRKGIVAFRDDTTLEKGKPISDELMQAIQGSPIFIVVFSKNYANSTWCLSELEQIMATGRTVLPVFYDVDPSEVRKQSGDYGKALAKHEERFNDLYMVQRWREALKNVASLAGWHLQNKPQDVEIENIIEKVSRNLDQYKFSSLPNNLVATPSLVEELQKLAGRVKESTLVNLTENPEKEIKGILRRELRRGFKQVCEKNGLSFLLKRKNDKKK